MWVEPHGKKWRIRDERGGRKVTVAGGYLNKTAAKKAMVRHLNDQQRGDELVPGGGQLTLAELIDIWWPHYSRALKPTALHSEGGRVRNHIRPLLGGYALADVDHLLINEWVGWLERGEGPMEGDRKRRKLAAKTVHNCHGVLFSLMRFAVDQRYRRDNPCAGTSLPKREQKEMRFLSDPEIARLVAALPEHWQPLVLLLVATGLRWGEAVGLRVGRVDLLAKKPKLLVVEHLHELSSTGEMVFTDPKSARSRRTVSFPLKVALHLTAAVAGKAPDEMVFTTVTGLKVRARNFRRQVWLPALTAAGLEGLRIHDLRHSHAAILISAGRPLSAISRRLGHSSIAVTDALYGHIREEADDGILVAIQDAIRAVGAEAVADEVADEMAEES